MPTASVIVNFVYLPTSRLFSKEEILSYMYRRSSSRSWNCDYRQVYPVDQSVLAEIQQPPRKKVNHQASEIYRRSNSHSILFENLEYWVDKNYFYQQGKQNRIKNPIRVKRCPQCIFLSRWTNRNQSHC